MAFVPGRRQSIVLSSEADRRAGATDTCCYLLFVNHNEFADTSHIRKFRNFEMEFLTVCSNEIQCRMEDRR